MSTPRTPDRLDRPSEDPLLYDIFPALATSVEWTLERTERALAMLGDPHRAYDCLHVGGTNGKGSVTTTLASIMREAGHRTGCYVSPHLVSFRERIRVDGTPLPDDTLKAYGAEVREAVSACGLTFFEAVTVLALHSFAREKVGVAALEVGLGGRLDSTNVVRPAVSAVTNVAMDHADFLGDTVGAIAREKAGIMKSGVPFVTTEDDPEILDLFQTHASAVGARMRSVLPGTVAGLVIGPDGTAFRMATETWGDLEVETPLVGQHQATNTALAVAVCEELNDALRPARSELLRGIASVRYRGRDEVVVVDGRTWLFDVAHNPAGMGSLSSTLDHLGLPSPRVALVSILGDKDWRTMLPPLTERCADVILTQAPTAPPARRWDLTEVGNAVRSSVADLPHPCLVHVVEDFRAAFDQAAAAARNGTVVVTGSVHTVGGAMRLLGIAPTD